MAEDTETRSGAERRAGDRRKGPSDSYTGVERRSSERRSYDRRKPE